MSDTFENSSGSVHAPGERWFSILSCVTVFGGLYLLSFYNYLFFHSIAEIFTIVIAFGIFVVAWNSRGFTSNHYLLFIGIAYLFVGGMDVVHALAYKGMGILPGENGNLPTQLWIAARYMESITLLLAPWFIGRRVNPRYVIAGYVLVFAILLGSIFSADFPICYIEGSGLTLFKKISEYVISLILAGALFFLLARKQFFDRRVLRLLLLSIVLTIASELAFTIYVGVYDLSNLAGHLLKIASFYLIYRAIIKTGLVEPYHLIFRDLKRTQDSLQKARAELEMRVEERTTDLRKSNELLKAEIAERKRAEETIRLQSDQYATILATSSDGFWRFGTDGKLLDVNEAYGRMSGYSRDELLHLSIPDIEALETPEEVAQHIRTVMETGFDRFESQQRMKNGGLLDVEISVSFSRATGQMLLFVRDITARKQAEAELEKHRHHLEEEVKQRTGELQAANAWLQAEIAQRKRMEEELQRSRDELEIRVQERTAEVYRQAELLDLAHEAIIVRDTEGLITFWNNGAAEVYGWTKEEALGKIMRALLHSQFPVPRDEVVAALQLEGRWEGEMIHTRKDGRKIHVLSRATVKKDEEGNPRGIMLINYDISQRVKLEERLRQAQKMEAIGTLAGGIAHDFNNLLQPILINMELALLDLKAGKLPSPESLWLAREGAKRGQELVKQIITFARKKEQPRKLVEMNPIIQETLQFLKSTIPTTIQIQNQVTSGSAVALADPSQIHQVLMNLCSNAAHAMREKGGILEVNLERVEVNADLAAQYEGLKPGPHLRLTVKDTGHGMGREVKERAFDPFFTTKKAGEGTGMGLAVVHGIVKQLEGAITLESEVGKGTMIRVFFPLFQGGRQEGPNSSFEPIPRGTERVLLVDDEEIQVRTLQAMLERLGYRVTAKTDPQQALELFHARPEAFDLVITDLTMPHLTGDRLAREVLSIRPDLPIILCTGFSERVDEEAARAIGIRHFALKPFTVRDMAHAIRRALSPN